MQALQRWLPRLLVLGAIGVVAAALFSDHRAAYGQVPLPQGGVVHLPEGESKVYLEDLQVDAGGDPRRLAGALSFQVVPAAGGAALELGSVPGVEGGNSELTERSQGIASKNAVAQIDAPAAGDYLVRGAYEASSSAVLTFGTDPFSAAVNGWKLWGGLLAAAVLIALIPKRRYRPSGEDVAAGRAAPGQQEQQSPVAGYEPTGGFTPYRG